MIDISIHELYMSRCIALARVAKERGDSPCGCVIVCDDNIIGEGIEGNVTYADITFHAEIEAVRRARQTLKTGDLTNCILYTTHEPCIMCSYVIRHARIPCVVFGASTGELGGVSSQYAILTESSITCWTHPPQVVGGILEAECLLLRKP